MLRKWDNIPEFMRIKEVKPYYDLLATKKSRLLLKRGFDLIGGIVLLFMLAVPMAFISLLVIFDSNGPVLYRQERVTMYGKRFRIHKFRTMVQNAESIGQTVTVNNDTRITKVGAVLRKYRLDELPQVFDLISGNMTFVGTRPEAIKYVRMYKPQYYATLLLPAGITSEASIRYKDEAQFLNSSDDVDNVYINNVLPEKMRYNLQSVKCFGMRNDIRTMVRTIFAVFCKE